MSNEDNIIIVGAGASGIAMACQLQRQLGFTNFEIYEKGAKIGGTWYYNTYPGCACDIPSHFYSFSFELNPNWSEFFSGQAEIQKYMQDVAEKYNLPSKTRLSTEVLAAKWNNDSGRWMVDFKDLKTGNEYSKTCKFLITAAGILSIPNECPVPGIESFRGNKWHSARWDYSVSLKGKNVIVIGNGCSATQFVPKIVPEVKSLVQFVRSQHYLLPIPNETYPAYFKWIMRNIPGAIRLYRFGIALILEASFPMFIAKGGASMRKWYSTNIIKHMKKAAPEKYHDIIIPKYEIGAKRRVLDTKYLTSLHDPKLLLMTDPCVQIKEHSVVTKSGAEYPADVIIYANGFAVQKPMVPMKISGRSGEDIQTRWERQGGARAYMGSIVPDFPNMFILLGPNLGTGHFSCIFTTECTVNLVNNLISPFLGIKEKGVLELAQEAEDREYKWIQDNLNKCIWGNGEQGGWYVNRETGHNSTVYPHFQTEYWWKTRKPKWSDFEIFGKKKRSFAGVNYLLVAVFMLVFALLLGWLRK